MKAIFNFSSLQTHTGKLLLDLTSTPWFASHSSLRNLQEEFLRVLCLLILSANFLLLFIGSWVSYQFYGVITLVSLGILLLNKRGNFTIARWLFMVCVHAAVFFLSAYRVDLLVTYGVLIGAVFISYLLYFNEEHWQLIGNVLMMLIIFSVFQITSYSIPVHVEVTDELLNRTFIINIVCILGSVLLSLLYLIIVYENSETHLRRTLTELQQRNHEMDHYVYRVSHDLRAPLCSVTGLVNLAADEAEPEVLRNYLAMIGGTISKADNFIQSVLSHSKVLNTHIQPTPVNLEPLVDTIFQDLRYMEGWNKVRLSIEETPNVPFHSDLFRLTIILNNIIANAIQFRNQEAAESYLSFAISTDASRALIHISDNGIGIRQDNIPRIFDMFYRGSELSTGSGLGLYIVKQALQMIDGKIEVVSQPGQGTTFTLTLKNFMSSQQGPV